MLKYWQVAGSVQCTEVADIGEQRGSFAPGVVHGGEDEATALSNLLSLLAEKTDGSSNCLQGSAIYLSANDLTGVVVSAFAHHERNQALR